jgi:hypothetical protein
MNDVDYFLTNKKEVRPVDQRIQYFFNAVVLNQVEEVGFLLEGNPQLVLATDDDGNSALHLVTSIAMANKLTCHGADPSKANKAGLYPDEVALQRSQEAVANVLRRSWGEAARG